MTAEVSPRRGGDDGAATWVDPETGKLVRRVWSNFANGTIPWSELDDEELARLQCRDRNGTFTGGVPRVVPRDLAQMHARELLARNDKLMKDVVLKATAVFTDVIDSPTASDADKMRAAQYLHDRILGKTPDKVEIKAELKPWESVAEDIGVITE